MNTLNLIGAICALWIFSFSILVFLARLGNKPQLEKLAGYLLYLAGLPLIYLLFTAAKNDRPILYSIQITLMLLWIVVSILVDNIFKLDFRSNRRWVIVYVMLFFAGTGGMLGVASLAGSNWMIAALVLFLLMTALTFYQRAKTGK